MLKRKVRVIFASLMLSFAASHAVLAKDQSPVIEVVTMKLRSGVTSAEFTPVDRSVETQYISRRSGFLSRESAPGSDGSWLVIVHWRSVADADASMKSFLNAPAAAKFMSMVEPDSMTMRRYSR